MITKMMTPPRWTTSSFGESAETSPMELSALGEHLSLCNSATGRFFGLQCQAEAIHGFVLPRLMSTLVVATFLLGAVFLVS